MRSSLLVVALLAVAAQAQPAEAPPVAEAEALLAAGDSAAAVAALDAALRDAPDDAALRRLRLRLRVDGPGVRGLPRPLRHQQILDAARALLRRAPDDTLALRVLTEEAVWTALTWHDRVALGQIRNPYGEFVSDAEVRARTARTKFEGAARRAMAPDLDRSQRATDAAEDATGYIETWLAQDPATAAAYEALATLAVLDEDWARLGDVAARFGAVSDDPRADLYAGLAAYRRDAPEAAEAAFERALAALPPAERARYQDIRSLLPRDLREAYDAAPEAAAAAFWAEADPRLLTAVNERRAEHRARVVEADLLFGRTADDLFLRTAPRGAETARGRLWVRYGRPEAMVRFATDDDAADFYGERDTRLAVWDYDGFTFAFDDPFLSETYRTYSPPARAFGSPAAANDDFVAQDARMQRDDPQRTQDLPETALDVPALVSRFRAPGGGTDVVVGFGVPVAEAPAPLRTGVFALADGAVADRAVAVRDRLSPGRTLRSDDGPTVWADGASVRLPGAGSVRVEVEAEGGDARGATTETIEPLPPGFGVSDLLLATSVDAGGRGPVVRDGLGIVPAPRAVFAVGDPVHVVIEAYGLALEDGRGRYAVEAELRPEARRGGLLGRLLGRGQGPGVAVRSEAEGGRPTETLSFFLDVGRQDPGRYTLTVTVEDRVSGRSASAERRVVLE